MLSCFEIKSVLSTVDTYQEMPRGYLETNVFLGTSEAFYMWDFEVKLAAL